MKKILITGSNGQLGRALNKLYSSDNEYELINTDFGVPEIKSLDITNLEDVRECVREIKPDYIVNCAAMTAVDMCDVKQAMAFNINAVGPRNLAIAATENGSTLMHVSTDYVFKGEGDTPYTEFDTPSPISTYGKSKLAGENFVRQFAPMSYIVRTAWLYGDGKNFVKTMLKASETRDSVTVVNDQIGSPTSAEELAKAIKYLLPTENFGLFHGTCEGTCSWADFTKEIYRLSGKKTEVIPISSEEYKRMNPQSADRPKNSRLENYMFKLTTDHQYAYWHDAIKKYIEEI